MVKMKVVIVLPTYNERDNIQILIPMIYKEVSKLKHDVKVLVVDDSSPDGTGDVVLKLRKKYTFLSLLTGKKEGLGRAIFRGFMHASKKMKADVIFEMDADLQHPANLIPKMIQKIESGYDVVVASRYIKGGATPDWNLKRKAISRGGNLFARFISGLYKVHDCTSGFRAIRTKFVNKIKPKNLHTRGYAFQITFLYELLSVGAKVAEVPLVFYDRSHGESKLAKKDIIEFFFNSFKLRFRSIERMTKFLFVGASGILVNLGIFIFAKYFLGLNFGASAGVLLISSLLGDEISILWNFFFNHVWTFKESNNDDHIFVKLGKFHLIALFGILINNAILFGLHYGFGLLDVLSKFIGILVAFLWNYLMNVKWTWREKI